MGERWKTLLDSEQIGRLEVYLEKECSDLCAPQSEQRYRVDEAVPFVVRRLRARIKELKEALQEMASAEDPARRGIYEWRIQAQWLRAKAKHALAGEEESGG